jgi:hypothetical protein
MLERYTYFNSYRQAKAWRKLKKHDKHFYTSMVINFT